MSLDPLAIDYPTVSDYVYVLDNPIMLVDPTGKAPDWVKNNDNGDYEYMDNVKEECDTPDGYSYVGKSGDDIVKDLGYDGVKSDVSTERGYMNGENEPGGVTNYFVTATVTTTAKVSAVIQADKANATSNNKKGLTFKGLKLDVRVGVSHDTPYGPLYAGAPVIVTTGSGKVKQLKASTLQLANGNSTWQTFTGFARSENVSPNLINKIQLSGSLWDHTNSGSKPLIFHPAVPIPNPFSHEINYD